jgi:hypothetical protein
MTIAHILDLSPTIRCFHEPWPRLIIESKQAYESSPSSKDIYRACRIDLVAEVLNRGLVYAECANRSTFFAYHVDAFFNRKVKFIHLVRELEGVVQSGIKRQWYAGNPWDIGRIIPKGGWNGQSQREKITWLWHETNHYIEQFFTTVDSTRKYCLKFKDLVSDNLEPVQKVFSFIGIETPEEDKIRQILNRKLNASRQNTNGKDPN